jgi:hypothetical protein
MKVGDLVIGKDYNNVYDPSKLGYIYKKLPQKLYYMTPINLKNSYFIISMDHIYQQSIIDFSQKIFTIYDAIKILGVNSEHFDKIIITSLKNLKKI